MKKVTCYFSRFTESGQSAIVLYPVDSTGFGVQQKRVPVYANAQAVLDFNELAELTEKDQIKLPAGLELIPMLDDNGEPLATKEGATRMTFK